MKVAFLTVKLAMRSSESARLAERMTGHAIYASNLKHGISQNWKHTYAILRMLGLFQKKAFGLKDSSKN